MCWNCVYFNILDHTLLHIACKNIANLHTMNTRKGFQVVIEYHVGKDVLHSFAFFSIEYVISGDFEAFCTTMCRLCAGLNECRLQRDTMPWLRPRVSVFLALTALVRKQVYNCKLWFSQVEEPPALKKNFMFCYCNGICKFMSAGRCTCVLLYHSAQWKSTGGYLQRPVVCIFRTGAGQNAIPTVIIMFVWA